MRVSKRRFFNNLRRPRFNAVKAVIAHLGPPFGKKTARLIREIVALERRKPENAGVAVAGFLGQDEEVKEQKFVLERIERLLV
jgi:hypothetical protein